MWVGILGTILALGIAITLALGLLALSYARATTPALPTPATPPAEVSNALPTPSASAPVIGEPANTTATQGGPSLADQLRNNTGGVISRGAASLLMLLLLFFVGQLGLRATLHPAALGVAVACSFGFAILAAVLALGGSLRFTLTSDVSILEYISYLVLIGLNLVMATVLAVVGRIASVCRSFAILMAIVAAAQLLLTLFGTGLRFDLNFLINFIYLLILMGIVAVLLYVTGLLEQLYPSVRRAA